MPVRFCDRKFEIDRTGRRIRLLVAKGYPELWLRLACPIPYPLEAVRAVTLVQEGGRLYLDVTALLNVEDNQLDATSVGGVDLGIIHPFAVVTDRHALLISGRALRAEERLHLADQKARSRRSALRAPKRGQRGSKRWRKHRWRERRAEARHSRRIRQAHHEAARLVVSFAVRHGIGTLRVGQPKGITRVDHGAVQNLRLRHWHRSHLTQVLKDKAEVAGIRVDLVDERGTSSTCPACRRGVSKPKGRIFRCIHCGFQGHRDLVGAHNIAANGLGGGITRMDILVLDRRAGHPPARRDRRRQLYDDGRQAVLPGTGPPGDTRESLATRGDQATTRR
jgi:putative transposase